VVPWQLIDEPSSVGLTAPAISEADDAGGHLSADVSFARQDNGATD